MIYSVTLCAWWHIMTRLWPQHCAAFGLSALGTWRKRIPIFTLVLRSATNLISVSLYCWTLDNFKCCHTRVMGKVPILHHTPSHSIQTPGRPVEWKQFMLHRFYLGPFCIASRCFNYKICDKTLLSSPKIKIALEPKKNKDESQIFFCLSAYKPLGL